MDYREHDAKYYIELVTNILLLPFTLGLKWSPVLVQLVVEKFDMKISETAVNLAVWFVGFAVGLLIMLAIEGLIVAIVL